LVAKASALRPSQRQLDWQRLGRTAFLHFGMNTFTGQEWGTGTEDPDLFAPRDLDTDQWARTLRDSGFELAILVVKHHDGFVLYPSRYTGHSVAASAWRNGTGDVLREFTRSMHGHGLRVGVYLSPADENQYHDGVYADGSAHTRRTIPTLVDGDDRATRVADGSLPTFRLTADRYGAYLLNQLYEVLTEYGPIDEVWFDGARPDPAGQGRAVRLRQLVLADPVAGAAGGDLGDRPGRALGRRRASSPTVVRDS
jgi:alpha-L-fucosidase